jgi:hypothetical protein
MSRPNRAEKPGAARATMRHALAEAGPLATTNAAVRHGVNRSRTWAAPQVERTGQFLRQSVAPKLSALLSSAARKIDPAQPPRRRWTKGARAAGLLAAAGVAAAVFRNRGKPAATQTAEESEQDAAGEAVRPQHITSTEAEASQQDVSPTDNTAL